MSVDIGELRHRITLQGPPVKQADGMGGGRLLWPDVATVWASIEPARANERFRHSQIESETTHVITIRYRAGVTSAMRVQFGSRFFRILGVRTPSEIKSHLLLDCLEVLP